MMTKGIKKIFRKIVSQGLSAKELSLAVSLGFTLGLFPVLGATSVLCLGAAGALRLNLPVIQAMNWLSAPLQLLLIVPFMKSGAGLVGLDATLLTVERLSLLAEMGIIHAFGELGVLIVAGIVFWLLVSVPIAVTMYLLTSVVIRIFGWNGRKLPGVEPGL